MLKSLYKATRVATLFGFAAFGTSAWAQTDVVIGASSVGGSYFLYSGGVAGFLNENQQDVVFTARTTRGSVENLRLLTQGRIQVAFAAADTLYLQAAGKGAFEGQSSDQIRALALIDLAPQHWVVMADSDIREMGDLTGVRVSIGAAGSGAAAMATSVLAAAGLVDAVQIINLGFDESATNMRDGNLEAMAASSSIPMPAVSDLATTHSIRILDIDDATVDALQIDNPAIERVVIPAGSYSGVDNPVATVASASTFVTHAEMDEDLVYEIVSKLITSEANAHMKSVFRAWDPSPGLAFFERLGVPLHPGAERAYRDAGLIQ